MTTQMEIDVDYIGLYITPAERHEREYEIVMANGARFKDEETGECTASQAILSRIEDKLQIRIHGRFQERPITMKTRHIRANVYINIRHSARILKWVEQTFKPSFISKIQPGPDPSRYIMGPTWIPLEGKPSMEIRVTYAEFITTKWKIRGENKRAFLDIERDKEFNRIQIHLGIRFDKYTLLSQAPVKLEEFCSVNGIIEVSKEYVDRFYSYLKLYAI